MAMDGHRGRTYHPWLSFATTFDGGRTWQTGQPQGGVNEPASPLGAYDFAADPMVSFTKEGGVVLMSLVGIAAPPFTCHPLGCGVPVRDLPSLFLNRLDLAAWVSSDGGRTFDEGRLVARGAGPVVFTPVGRMDLGSNDREHLTLDSETGVLQAFWNRIDGGLRGGYDIFSSRSLDGGKTWSDSRVITRGGYGVAAAALDGRVLLAYRTIGGSASEYSTMVSSDGGKTWNPPVRLATAAHYGTIPVALWRAEGSIQAVVAYSQGEKDERVVLQRSGDGGQTWEPASPVFESRASAKRLPAMAVDPHTGLGALSTFQGADGGTELVDVWALPIADGAAAGPPLRLSDSPIAPFAAFDYQSVDVRGETVYAAWGASGPQGIATHVAPLRLALP